MAVQWLLMFGLPIIAPHYGGLAVIAGAAGALIVAIWWLMFSRAPWLDRVAAIAAIAIAVAITTRVVHESIANGMMGFMLYIYAAPVLSLALVAWAVASRSRSDAVRRTSLVVAVLVACGALTLVRTNGLSGDAGSDFEWRWAPTAEQRLLARSEAEPSRFTQKAAVTPPPAPLPTPATPEHTVAPTPSRPDLDVWPGFRGPLRDSVVRGVRIETDWSRHPPVELWRRPIGPGWSSFAVADGLVYTQEQRGEDEIVSAYDLKTGTPVWMHRDAARFWESNAGAGPRATPTLSGGRAYAHGATGILNALDARDGSVVWSRNTATDTSTKVPDWGIASSPLMVGDVVVAAAAGSLAAYDVATGTPRWFGPKGGGGYSSPHAATIDGVQQIVFVNGPGVVGVAPSDGTVLWSHAWGGDSIVQPAVLAGNDLLIGSGSGLAANTGMLRITVAHAPSNTTAPSAAREWTVKERWTSTALKPYFNDFVVHQGHAFGFDGSILACVDINDGTRKWKGGRYGHGQVVLLPDQNLLLVLTEDGELALVSASPDKFTEIARVPALNGKTWNHPVLVGDVLLVRNGEEMAAFRLASQNIR